MTAWQYAIASSRSQRVLAGDKVQVQWILAVRQNGEVIYEATDLDNGSRLNFHLNKLGADGWEIVHVDTEKGLFDGAAWGLKSEVSSTVSFTIFLKRPAP